MLLDRLESNGNRDYIHNWFKSYLTNRSQYVEYMNGESDAKLEHAACPKDQSKDPTYLLYI